MEAAGDICKSFAISGDLVESLEDEGRQSDSKVRIEVQVLWDTSSPAVVSRMHPGTAQPFVDHCNAEVGITTGVISGNKPSRKCACLLDPEILGKPGICRLKDPGTTAGRQ